MVVSVLFVLLKYYFMNWILEFGKLFCYNNMQFGFLIAFNKGVYIIFLNLGRDREHFLEIFKLQVDEIILP